MENVTSENSMEIKNVLIKLQTIIIERYALEKLKKTQIVEETSTADELYANFKLHFFGNCKDIPLPTSRLFITTIKKTLSIFVSRKRENGKQVQIFFAKEK